MDIAKLFKNGHSQAVRLPKAYRFEGDEVYIKHTSEGVLLIPKESSIWDHWEKSLLKTRTGEFIERNQPKHHQEREGLDEMFD
jgi:antitoxin VapB